MGIEQRGLSTFDLAFETEHYAYRLPMKFGGRVVTDATIANVRCRGDLADGRHGNGFGSMTMGVVWAWPSQQVDAAQALAVVVELSRRLVEDAQREPVTGHPLEICLQLKPRREQIASALEAELGLPEPIPALARLLAASPLEAALFDAFGKAWGKSCYQLLGPDYLGGDLARFLGAEFRGLTLDQFISPVPAHEMPLYHLVGALDPLTQIDVLSPIGDGLPENLDQWIARDGLTHLKIKLDGADAEWDYQRIVSVDESAEAGPRGSGASWCYSLDFNERCQNEDYVLRLLDKLELQSTRAFQRIQYIEQPTHRDLKSHPENTMHRVAARMPVVIDESLVDYESLLLAREQGYSGVAIKACKGQAEALLMAAAAQHHNMYLCVQDLTCVGASFLHSASLTAHLPGAAAIEGNGRQYCPAANVGWDERYPGMFNVVGGRLPTHLLNEAGLGYTVVH